MLSVKVHKKHAEKVKRYLARRELMDNNYRIDRRDEFIYFPINPANRADSAKLARLGGEITEAKPKARRSRSAVALGEGYDITGEIAIIDQLGAKAAKRLAEKILKVNKNVKTVLSKAGPVKGLYRTRSFAHVAGKRQYSTVYRENGAAFRIDVRKAFFSPRLAFERNRITGLVRPKENVAVMFAGAGPFAIEIAKKRKDARVIAIELNRAAYLMMLDNIGLNKTANVTPVLGDVKRVAARYRNSMDRIVMPLPKDSYEFLDSALLMARKGCIVHYYAFGERLNAFDHHLSMLAGFFRKRRRKMRLVFKRRVRTYSPREIEIVLDFKVL